MDKSFGVSTRTVPTSQSRSKYRPFVLRVPTLLFVFSIALLLIALLEYASRALPHASKGHSRLTAADAKVSSILHRRDDSSISTSSLVVMTLTTSAPAAASTSSDQPTLVTNPNAYVTTKSISETSINVGVTNPNAYVSTEVDSTTTDGYVSTKITVGATNPNAYVSTEVTASTSAYVPTVVQVTSNPTTVTSVQTTLLLSTSSDGSVNTITSSFTTVFPTTTAYTVFPTSVEQSSTKTFWTTEVGTTTSSLVTTDAQGHPTTIVTAVLYSTTRQATTTVAVAAQDNKGMRIVSITKSWPLWKVFVGGYLPVFLVVIFKLFWTAIYAKIKLIEPFTRLARPEGAVASETLHTYYLSSSLMPDAIVSFVKGHWLVFWSAIVYLAVGLLAPLASEVMFLDTNWGCPNPDYSPGHEMNPCWPPQLSVDPLMVRLLQGLLAYIAVMTITLTVMLLRCDTGLYYDPSSIGAVASLMHHPEVLEDFRNMEDEILLEDMRRQLGDKRYKLDDYQRADGTWRYGFVPMTKAIQYEWNEKSIIKPSKRTKTWSDGSRQQGIFDAVTDSLFAAFLVGLLGLIIAYFKDSSNSGFNRFFNSNGFGPRFIFTATGSLISLNFKRLERDAHTLAPYRALSHTPSPARSTILLSRRSLPYTALISMTYHKHLFASTLALVAILSDILVITLAGIPYSPGQIYLELLVCSYTSIIVLGLMVSAVVGLMVWRRGTPDLPRTPDTILSVMSYVADSRLLDDFEGCEVKSAQAMRNQVEGLGKRYGYGRFVGVDGKTKWMVDTENPFMV